MLIPMLFLGAYVLNPALSTEIGEIDLANRSGALSHPGLAEGLDDLGTKGIGSGTPEYGSVTAWVRATPETIDIGNPIVLGALDKSLIDEVIKRHMGALRGCYAEQLQRKPTLRGRMTVKFVIGVTGHVSKVWIQGSTVDSTELEECLQSVFEKMRFPSCKGGGIVIVSYPLHFFPGAIPEANEPVEPGISRHDIEATIERNYPTLLRCGAEHNVDVQFNIRDDGTITQLKLFSDRQQGLAEYCIRGVFEEMDFGLPTPGCMWAVTHTLRGP